MKMTASIKNLLGANRKALQFLHYAKGMDFEQPFAVIEGTVSFTMNSLKKKVVASEIIDDINNGNYALFIEVFYPDTRIYNPELKIVDIADKMKKFEQVDNVFSFGNGNSCEISNFCRVSDFEDVRKGKVYTEKTRWFLIVQDKKYISEKAEKKIDRTERVIEKGKHLYQNNARISEKSSIYSYHNHIDEKDKSGYYIYDIHAEYERRVNRLKAEKAKQKADTEVDKYIINAENLKAKIDGLKPLIIQLLNNNELKELKKLDDIFNSCNGYSDLYKYSEIHIKMLNNKEYKSIEAMKREEEYIERIYDKIYNIIIQ